MLGISYIMSENIGSSSVRTVQHCSGSYINQGSIVVAPFSFFADMAYTSATSKRRKGNDTDERAAEKATTIRPD